jgi:hypothetical protein
MIGRKGWCVMREILPVGAIILVGGGGSGFMLALVAVLVVPSLVLSIVGAALGVRRMPDAAERVAGWITGVFCGTATGAIALVPLGTLLGNEAGVYAFLPGPTLGALAAYCITRFMTLPA